MKKRLPRELVKRTRFAQPKRSHQNGENSRRGQVIDAALRLLARGGARGLTHRRVDLALKIPEGSTSVYFRTRADLFAAVAIRVAELDFEDVHEHLDAPASAGKEVNSGVQLAGVVLGWVSPEKRDQSLARLELWLEATRDEVIRDITLEARKQFISRLDVMFQYMGAQNPTKAAEAFADLSLGVVYTHLVLPKSQGHMELEEQLGEAVFALKAR